MDKFDTYFLTFKILKFIKIYIIYFYMKNHNF